MGGFMNGEYESNMWFPFNIIVISETLDELGGNYMNFFKRKPLNVGTKWWKINKEFSFQLKGKRQWT